MIIRQYTNGVAGKAVVEAKDIPQAWVDVVNGAFDNCLSGKRCIQGLQIDSDRYEFYILGTYERSVPISGVQFISTYKLGFNVATGERWDEVYYVGYSFDVPDSLKFDRAGVTIMTSVRYESEAEISRSLYLMRHDDLSVDFADFATALGFTEDVAIRHGLKVDLDLSNNIIKRDTYSREYS